MRYRLIFGASLVAGSGFLTAALATSHVNAWLSMVLFAPLLALPPLWLVTTIAYAIATDTNAEPEALAESPA